MRFKKPTLLVDEADLETVDYNDEPNEDIFANESILAAANKVFDFDKYKKEQTLNRYNKLKAENDLKQAETINYVHDFNLDDVRENKNARIAAKKVSDKQRKIRKRKRPESPAVTFEGLKKPTKRRKRPIKSALVTARNISKKYKNLRFC